MPFAVVILRICGGQPVIGRCLRCIVALFIIGSDIRVNAYFVPRVFSLEGNAINAVCLCAHTLAVSHSKAIIVFFCGQAHCTAAVHAVIRGIFKRIAARIRFTAVILPVKRSFAFGIFNFKIVVFGIFKQCERDTFKRCAAFRYI